ncbi:phosphatase PAP2 family protein [Streptomyces sp. NPDC059875]|uniref:phosphatase PAP2 family protein n=1 Tax=unclassified Streptomyces TaxID=2593676 RepID=UPI003666F565
MRALAFPQFERPTALFTAAASRAGLTCPRGRASRPRGASPWWALGYALLPLIGWSRVTLRDHTLGQVTAGTFLGAVVAGTTFGLVI